MVTYSPTGWAAQYTSTYGLTTKAVERFSDQGDALVVDPAEGVLKPARSLPDFDGLRSCTRTWSVLPCQPGWRVAGQLRDFEDEQVTEDVHGWLVNDAGNGDPLIVDREFATLAPAHEVIPKYTLLGPDEDDEPDGG